MADPDATSILQRLEAILGRVPKVDDDERGTDKPVPYHRFHEAQSQAKAAREALAAMQAEIKALEATHAQALKAAQESAGAEVGKLAARHQEDMSLYEMGLDADGREAVRLAYQRQPEASRGKSAADWWKASVEAHKAHIADPKAAAPEIPRTLAGYLPGQAEPEKKAAPAPGRRLSPDVGVVVGGQRKGPAQKISEAKTWAELQAAMAEADAGR